ncbi:MAG: 2-oxoacid:ferredoxin oxidoreductase subunit beta, partial [Frankiales bacterium]|nr:2-oxoacid:ferredoxin oxidoreductase subunit beta [Frankiales bacterium]
LVEIYQNCNIFNDGAFDAIRDPDTREDWFIKLEHGQPIRFGRGGRSAVVAVGSELTIEQDVAPDDPRVVVHDAHSANPGYAYALARLQDLDPRYAPMGVLRDLTRPVFDEQLTAQLTKAGADRVARPGRLAELLRGKDSWSVS